MAAGLTARRLHPYLFDLTATPFLSGQETFLITRSGEAQPTPPTPALRVFYASDTRA